MEALLDPRITALLQERLPDLEKRVELGRTRSGNVVERRVHCVPIPKIPDAAQAVVKPEMIAWVETARFDLDAGMVDVQIRPAGFRNVFSFQGHMRLEPTGQHACIRRVDAVLEIKIFWVGRYVEDYLVEQIRRNMEVEGEVVREFLDRREKATV
jgi:hypothetical protein